MRRFLLAMALTFGCGLGAAWWWAAHGYMSFAVPDYALWKARGLMLDDCRTGTVAVIGDSQAETSIVPKRLGPDVMNFGLTGASFITMLEVSRRIVACPDPPKIVVITFAPNQFWNADMFWEHEVRFDIFPLDLDKVRQRARGWGDTSLYDPPAPFDFDARFKNVLFQARFPSYYFGSMAAAYGFRRKQMNLSFLRDTLKDRGYHYIGETTGNDRIDYRLTHKHFVVSGFLETYFGEILALFENHHIPVLFISAPFKSSTVQAMYPEFRAEYAQYVHQWESVYPNFHVVGDIIPSLPPEDFSDAMHLNAMGAATASDRVAKLLHGAGVDTGAFVMPGSP